jgi:hypothetical protein
LANRAQASHVEEETDSESEEEAREELRREAAETLKKAAMSGALDTALKKIAEAKATTSEDQLRSKVRLGLLQGAYSGKLDEIFASVKEQRFDEDRKEALRLKVRNSIIQGATNGKLEQFFETHAQQKKENDDTEEMRLKLRQVVLEGAKNGKLEEFLASRCTAKRTGPAAQQQEDIEASADEVENLRQQAMKTLSKAALSGELQAMFEKRHEEKQQDALRMKIKETLLKGAKNGQLAQVLSTSTPASESKSEQEEAAGLLKQKAYETLLKAAQNGQLKASLAKCRAAQQDEDLDDLRLQVKSTLVGAVNNGRLQSVLTDVFDKKRSEELRMQLRKTLVEGCANGKVAEYFSTRAEANASPDSVVEDLKQKFRQTLLKTAQDRGITAEAEDLKTPQELHLEALKKFARETFLKAAHRKEEEKNCQQKVSPLQQIKLRAKAILLQAANDGELVTVLNEVAPRKVEALAPDLKQLKLQLKATLMEAALNGRLASTVGQFATTAAASLPEAKVQEVRPMSSPARSKRRVFGGVVRAPSKSVLQEDAELPPPSPSPSMQFKLAKLPQYDLKSTQYDFKSSPKFEASDSLGAPAFDRPMSKSKSRLLAASSSALAMDLGWGAPSTTPQSNQTTLSQLQESLKMIRPSGSMSSLPTMKAKQLPGGLLPTLGGHQKSAQHIAQTMRMSQSMTRLHTPASIVF